MTEKKSNDSIPLWFIQVEIEKMLLETEIAMSEGDNDDAYEWFIKQSALKNLLIKWRTEGGNND